MVIYVCQYGWKSPKEACPHEFLWMFQDGVLTIFWHVMHCNSAIYSSEYTTQSYVNLSIPLVSRLDSQSKQSVVLKCCSHDLHIGSASFFIIFVWWLLVNRLWSPAAIIIASISTFSPALFRQWWVLCIYIHTISMYIGHIMNFVPMCFLNCASESFLIIFVVYILVAYLYSFPWHWVPSGIYCSVCKGSNFFVFSTFLMTTI